MIKQSIEKCVRFSVNKPVAVLTLSAVVVAILGWGLSYLKPKSDHRVYFDPSHPDLEIYEDLKATYARDNNLMIGIEARSGELLSAKNLRALVDISSELWTLPYVSRVNSLTNFQHISAEGDEISIANLVGEDLGAEDGDVREIREIASSDLDVKGSLIDDGLSFVNIIVHLEVTDPYDVAIPRAAAAGRAVVEEFRGRYPDLVFSLSGSAMLNNAFAEASQADMRTLIPLMYGVVIFIAAFLLRSLIGVLAVLLVVSLSTVCGMGFLGWMGIPISPPSAAAPIVIMTVSIADAIHIFTHLAQKLLSGLDRKDALIESITELSVPLFVTSFTTFIGFLGLNVSDSPPFRHLGNASAVGIAFAFFVSISTLPAFVSLLPVSRQRAPRIGPRLFERLAAQVQAHRIAIVAIFAVLILIASASIAGLSVDSNAFRYFDKSFAFRNATDKLVKRLGGLERLEYSLETGEEGGIYEPGFLADLERMDTFIRSLPNVVFVSSPLSIFKKLNQAMNGGEEEMYGLPSSYDLAAQYMTFYELSLPPGQELTNQIDLSKSAVRMTVGLGDVTTREFLAASSRIDQWVATESPSFGVKGPSGIATMFANITYQSIWTNIKGGGMAYAFITLILMLALRSWRLGLLSLLPNLVPCLFAIGAWGLFKDTIGLPGTIVFTLTIGIVVDDTVHTLARYSSLVRERAPNPIGETLSQTGPALSATSLILCAGFLILSLSPFTGNSHVGMICFLCIGFALVADLTLLPAILSFGHPSRGLGSDRA